MSLTKRFIDVSRGDKLAAGPTGKPTGLLVKSHNGTKKRLLTIWRVGFFLNLRDWYESAQVIHEAQDDASNV